MKNLLFLTVLIFSMPLGIIAQQSERQTKKERQAEEFRQMLELIDSAHFVFNADRTYGPQGRAVDLTTRPGSLEMRGDSAIAHLAYFGRARNVAYSSNAGGIRFADKLLDYSLKINEKKQVVNLSFTVKTVNEQYECNLEVFRSGSSTLIVTSRERDPATYNGKVSPLPE